MLSALFAQRSSAFEASGERPGVGAFDLVMEALQRAPMRTFRTPVDC